MGFGKAFAAGKRYEDYTVTARRGRVAPERGNDGSVVQQGGFDKVLRVENVVAKKTFWRRKAHTASALRCLLQNAKNIPALAKMGPAALVELSEAMRRVPCDKGDVVIRQHAEGVGLDRPDLEAVVGEDAQRTKVSRVLAQHHCLRRGLARQHPVRLCLHVAALHRRDGLLRVIDHALGREHCRWRSLSRGSSGADGGPTAQLYAKKPGRERDTSVWLSSCVDLTTCWCVQSAGQ